MPIYQLSNQPAFPPVQFAESSGLIAIGGALTVPWLLEAYRNGIYPWFNEGDPILWWSPDPRLVLHPSEIHVSRRLARTIKSGKFEITYDKVFIEVISECAAPSGPDRDATWITRDMYEAYCDLHRAGHAHSVETWCEGELVGGLYGVAIGAAFFGESMFTRESDASKVALVALARQLEAWNFDLIDCQMTTRHLMSMGAKEIPREGFIRILQRSVDRPGRPGSWADPPPNDTT